MLSHLEWIYKVFIRGWMWNARSELERRGRQMGFPYHAVGSSNLKTLYYEALLFMFLWTAFYTTCMMKVCEVSGLRGKQDQSWCCGPRIWCVNNFYWKNFTASERQATINSLGRFYTLPFVLHPKFIVWCMCDNKTFLWHSAVGITQELNWYWTFIVF